MTAFAIHYDSKAVRLYGSQMGSARNKTDVMADAGKLAADHAAYGTGAENANFHEVIRCSVEWSVRQVISNCFHLAANRYWDEASWFALAREVKTV